VKRFPLFLWAAYCLVAAPLHATDTRADFLKLIDRPRVPLQPKVQEISPSNGLNQFHFSFASDAEQSVTGILIKSEKFHRHRPVVIALHGTGGSKANMLALCRKLAEKGFIAVTIDGRYHGERIKSGKGTVEYQEAIVRAWKGSGEHPLYYDTVWDVTRLIDYLKTRKDVDAKRIGLIGISKGGIETYLAAAVDQRIAVAIPCIGVQSFRWALESNAWPARVGTIQNAFDSVTHEAGITNADSAFVKNFYDRVTPGIYDEFDGPQLLPLIAPRPLLVINGDSDDLTPLPGLKECTDAAQRAYHLAKADERFAVRIQEKTAHQVRPESEHVAIEWFVKWLKP
jgi:dienelactone hydrolase